MIFFADQAWFYLSARDALLTGHLPLLGITASITWLHQGPLWTYLLIPGLALTNFHPLSGSILAIIFSLPTPLLLYFFAKRLWGKSAAVTAVLLFTLNPWFLLVHSNLAYHTTPIFLFTLVFFWCLIKKHDFLTGLFLGLLYQLHLLTFIFWPIMLFRRRLIPGFILGIIPFLLAGPIQSFGIFIWLAKKAFEGFSGTGVLSDAYLVVVYIPAVLMISWLVSKLSRPIGILLIAILLGFGVWNFKLDRYGPSLSSRIALSEAILSESRTATPELIMQGPGAKFRSYGMPYEYLIWWLSRASFPSGPHSKFLIHEQAQTYEVLE